ncbi:hypothetical protein AGABI1DRAFT_107775 [Agaricus bisporus var. burnettii JB137-S8]|uniref:DUF6593 domain-containing protein n=1 Tax=Agaricus bisporus var. burnettii (strain JB137-S8 / ATCC MYA-4627 / FGSC 10392) TaxID=597362 RepID=K5VU60_AGABU|nr:uncharacterized protein AGABI1DRAFT_107775 [Agaricus bisporus var. burnettii JB137-S8]EKM78004.1 hypothetical protein AGABI1DRAFT_107775 [Agaricus bisporus var. burnettii JB137-S8]
MDSQVTLVNPDPLVMLFSRDNIKGTELIRRRGGGILYKVVPDETLSSLKTSVYRADSDTPMAFIETKNICGRDKITLRGGTRQNITDWISGYSILGSFPMTFNNNGRRYIWRKNKIQQLNLYNDYDPENPIATYERSKRRVIDGGLKSFPASLTLNDEATEIQDIIVISLLVVEGRIRGDFRPGSYRKSLSLWPDTIDIVANRG